MKVVEVSCFNPEFPEIFPWGRVDSILGAVVAADIVNHIEHECRKRADKRGLVPGLRLALRILAEHVDY